MTSDDPLRVRADERTTLTGTLDWFRAVVVNKVTGLSETDARRVMTPTGLSPLGVVSHLGWAERTWFQQTFAGETLTGIGRPDDSLGFVLDDEDTVESVVAAYNDSAERSRAITAATPTMESLSVRPAPVHGHVSLRWLLVHLIEETARHAGHLDLMRETIDGKTGD